MTAGGLDAERAVQVVARRRDGTDWRGSGYLITGDLVITAQHVVANAESVAVRFVDASGRASKVDGRVEWEQADADLAVVHLLAAAPVPDPVQPVRYGRLIGEAECEAVGYPWFELHDEDMEAAAYRNPRHVYATYKPSTTRSGELELRVAEAPPAHLEEPKRSAWGGMSGAAVFADGALVAVIGGNPWRKGPGTLTAWSIQRWYTLPDDRLSELCGLINIPWEAGHLSSIPGPDERVRSYLEAACWFAGDHPHPGVLGGSDVPSLAEVYVRQHGRPAAQRNHGVLGGGNPAPEGNVAALAAAIEPAEVVFRTEAHVCVLVSGPGGGKSTLLRTRLGAAASQWLDSTRRADRTDAAVPVWVSARDLGTVDRPVADVLAAATAKLSRYGLDSELDKTYFQRQPCAGASWLLLVDGLDELPDAAVRREVLKKLAVFTRRDPRLYRCVVATRPLAADELDVLDRTLGYQTPRYDLQPFTADDLRTYAGRYFGTRWSQVEASRGAQKLTDALDRTSLAELARTPLMAFMLCQLYLAAPERPLSESRTGLYMRFTDMVYGKNNSRQVSASHEEAIKRLAEPFQIEPERMEVAEAARQVCNLLPELIGYLAHQWRTGHRAPAVATLASHEAVRPRSMIPFELWGAFLEDLLRHTGLLVHRADGLDFIHQTFLEYHAARYATRSTEARRRVFYELFDTREQEAGRRRRLLREDPSYLGFLLDQLLTPHDGDQVSEETRARLENLITSASALDAFTFLSQQVSLKTELPKGSTTRRLTHLATDPSLPDHCRLEAAKLVAELDGDDEHRVQWLETLATHPTFKNIYGVLMAGLVAAADRDRGARLFETIGDDRSFEAYTRLRAAIELAAMDGYWAQSVRLLKTLATDPGAEASVRHVAAEEAVSVLARTDGDDEHRVQWLETLATDLAFKNSYRVRAASLVAAVDGCRDRGVELLDALANDPGFHASFRVHAAKELAAINGYRVQGAQLLETLATDPNLGFHQVHAADSLASMNGHRRRGTNLLETLASDPAFSRNGRAWARRLLTSRWRGSVLEVP